MSSHFQQISVWRFFRPRGSLCSFVLQGGGEGSLLSFLSMFSLKSQSLLVLFMPFIFLYIYNSRLYSKLKLLVNSISFYSHAILKPWLYLPSFSDYLTLAYAEANYAFDSLVVNTLIRLSITEKSTPHTYHSSHVVSKAEIYRDLSKNDRKSSP